MRKYYVILSVALVSLSVNIAIASQPSIEEILAYTPERQFEYLTMPSPEANAYYKNNSGEYSRLLVEIAASDIGASEIAMYILNNHILLLLSNKYSSAYNELIQSIIIEKNLSQIILMPYKDLKTKRGAILAHANLYPPNEELLQFYKYEIESSVPDNRGLIESILKAFVQYQSSHNIQMPEYVYKKLPELVNNHSDSVQSQAIMMLADKKGLDFLPELFTLLESNNHGASVSQSIVYNILSIDTSKGTIDRLKQSREKVNNTSIKELITNSIKPQNIERLQKKKPMLTSSSSGRKKHAA